MCTYSQFKINSKRTVSGNSTFWITLSNIYEWITVKNVMKIDFEFKSLRMILRNTGSKIMFTLFLLCTRQINGWKDAFVEITHSGILPFNLGECF